MRSLVVVAALLLGACGAHYPGQDQSSGGATAGGGSTTGAVACTSDWTATVGPMLQTHCASCHGTKFSDPSMVVTESTLVWSKVSGNLMPPTAPLTDPEKSSLQAWLTCQNDGGAVVAVDAGPTYTCIPDPHATTQSWSGDGYSDMLPGANCLGCHKSGGQGSPTMIAGGTVYSAASGGTGVGGATITLVDSSTPPRTASVQSSASGNFHFDSYTYGSLVAPFRVSVTKNGKTQAMSWPAPHGACNTCHQAPPDCSAPGNVYWQ